MRRSLGSAVAILLLLGFPVFGQTPPSVGVQIVSPQAPVAPGGVQRPGMPPRDSRGVLPTGTARLRGRVVSAQGGTPLRRAQVAITAAEIQLRRVTTTDAEGRFDFGELPAGRYSLNASKGGYVGLQYGQRRPFEAGTPVIVADGQTVTQLDFALPRGSVIAGRITDEYGEPMAQAQVQAQRYQYGPDGQRRLTMAGTANTDDLGQFRVFGLMPGEYVVSAGVRSPMIMATGANPNDVSEGYPPTFYPGTLNPGDAQAVTLGIGEESSLQLSLLPSRMARITGVVVDSQNRPVAGAMLMLRTPFGNSIMGMSAGQSGPDGAFVMGGVAPGDHVIEVRPQPRAQGEAVEFASVPVVVAGADVNGLRIVTGKGATVTGRVVFEGTSPRTGGLSPLRVMPTTADPSRPLIFSTNDPLANGTVADDGSFQISGVSGQILFRAIVPPGWTMKSISLDGEDITDEPVDATTDVSGLRVVLTDKLTDISGQVTDTRGQVLKDYVVVILPEEAKEGQAGTRFTRVMRPDQDGRFRVRGMPPGRYVATAVESVDQGRQFVPDIQKQLRDAGRRFSMREGETLSVDLRMTNSIN